MKGKNKCNRNENDTVEALFHFLDHSVAGLIEEGFENST